jgi:hypothetical protein
MDSKDKDEVVRQSQSPIPGLVLYYQSFGKELESVKDRVRSLIRHWPTDGAFKEDVLKSILRRHIPETLKVAAGFIVTPDEVSTEIDILIIDRKKPTLFKSDDLVIVIGQLTSAYRKERIKAQRRQVFLILFD